MTITYRPAQPQDKEAVLAFTKNTWPWGDYIAWVWDDWLARPQAELSVADSAGQPVAVAMASLLSPTEGWLQGLRVHPAFRRQGIADGMTDYQLHWLRERQAVFVRLGVYASNPATQTLAPRAGFRRLATFSILPRAAALPDAPGPLPTRLTDADAADAWRLLRRSTVYRAAAGLYATDWMFHTLTEAKLALEIAQGAVLGLRGQNGGWSALAITATDAEAETLLIGYVDGEAGPLAELPGALARWARQSGLEKVLAMLPPAPEVLSMFVDADYGGDESEGPMYVYERRLP